MLLDFAAGASILARKRAHRSGPSWTARFVSHPIRTVVSMSYKCNGCGFSSGKWMGFCPQCRTPEPLEESRGRNARNSPVRVKGRGETRLASGVPEFDRVLGNGMVPGSSILLGGEPGIGKSTLLLQLAAGFSNGGHDVLVATAEESVDQVAMRADRLGCSGVSVVAESDVDSIIEMAGTAGVAAVIVDSIQTVSVGESNGVSGGSIKCASRHTAWCASARNRGPPSSSSGM